MTYDERRSWREAMGDARRSERPCVSRTAGQPRFKWWRATCAQPARLAFVALGLLLSGASASAADLRVVATIKPIHALVSGVMEGVGTAELLVSGSASPHTFALKPSGAQAINAAAVLFRVSAAVEPFTVRVVDALPSSVRVATLADAPGVTHLALRRGATFDAHAHDGHDHHEPDLTRDGVARDGHVWLDPDNAKAMVQEIARVLSEVAPAHAPVFAANAMRVNRDIDGLDTEIKAMLKPVAGEPYVVFHDAYQYFERHYGLAPVAAITLGPEVQPGARRLAEIRSKIAGLKAVCIFAEPQFSDRVMRSVTDETSARFGTLDPEGALVEPGAGAYTALMRNLATNLRRCMDGSVSGGG